jgi:hypothetical protein
MTARHLLAKTNYYRSLKLSLADVEPEWEPTLPGWGVCVSCLLLIGHMFLAWDHRFFWLDKYLIVSPLRHKDGQPGYFGG